MDNVRDIPFAVFETENGQLIGKFKKTSVKKTLKLVDYLETQIEILRHPTKCHRLRTILEMKGIHHERRNLERH